MRRIRIGNDFVYIWVIERMGEAEDLTVATSVKVTLSTHYDSKEIPFQIVDGNKIRIEFTPDILTPSTKKALLGKPTTYNLTLFYILPDAAVEDLDRVCTVDVDAFILVPKSAQADDVEEFTYTSDVGVGLKGDKGDKGDNAFVVWQSQSGNEGKTEQDYFDFLQEPANEAIQQVLETEGEIIAAEGLRVIAEQGRFNAEGLRYDAEVLRIAQYGLSQQATQDANDAADLANEKAGIANQAAIDANNAIDNIASTLALKEDKANKKSIINPLSTDEYPNSKAVADELALKVDKSAVKQTIGNSTTDVMSQKAVTDELAKKHQVVVNYTHTGNKEVNIESIDFATGTITATGHGLAVNNSVYLINKGLGNFPFSAVPNGINPLTRYNVVNVTPNTFLLTSGGAPITLSDKATKDYSKWHLEDTGTASISGLSLRKFTVEIEGKSSGIQAALDYFYLYGEKNYGVAGAVWITDTEYGKIASGLNRSIFKSMANGDIWSYNRLDIDVTGKRASILINGYRIYSLTETTSGIIRHNNEVAVHSSVAEDVVTSLYQAVIFNGMNIKVTKIL